MPEMPIDDSADNIASEINTCWRNTGINGDNSCAELEEYIHCRNCPAFKAAGRALLGRASAMSQVEQWTDKIGSEREDEKYEAISVGIFKLHNEWLALPTSAFSEVANDCNVRRISHGKGGVLLGICSIRGEIQLCVSLEKVLGMECHGYSERSRFCVLAEDNCKWVFPVDSVSAVAKINKNDIEPTPANLQSGLNLFSCGIFEHDGHKVGLLEANMIFHALARSVR